MSNIEEFVNSLNIPFEGSYSNNQYIINLKSSDDFSKVFSIISLNSQLRALDGSTATDSETEFRYTDGYYEVLLSANYDEDVYSILIEVK